MGLVWHFVVTTHMLATMLSSSNCSEDCKQLQGVFSLVFIGFLVVSTSAINCLERLVSEMTLFCVDRNVNPTKSTELCPALS